MACPRPFPPASNHLPNPRPSQPDTSTLRHQHFATKQDARLRSLADFENLQKISAREKAQAKDFALSSFAKDLIGSIDVLRLALNSIPAETITAADANKDLKELHTGVALTKASIEKVLARHGVVSFDPVGEQFDPNLHEALYQAPVPGKEPGSVLETQELGCELILLWWLGAGGGPGVPLRSRAPGLRRTVADVLS